MGTPPDDMTIGPYRLIELLGKGAMGEVWLAEHAELPGAPCALKLLNEAQSADPEGLRRFQREAEALAQLDRHPAIVKIHAAGVAPDGRPFYAMEYVEGQTLKQVLHDGLGREAALDVVEQVADGLAFAHLRGIVHRDVKPENVLLADDGSTRLTDFGLARLEGPGNDRLTRTGEIVGTPIYMAPEQLDRTRGAIGPWTDVWALGTTLYEVLTGSPPYLSRTSLEVYTKLTERAPIPPPSKQAEDVSRALDAVCTRALQHDPTRRFPDAGAFLEALRAARAGEEEEAAPAPRGLLVLTAGALLLAVVALGARAVTRERPGPTPGPTPPAPSEPKPPAPTTPEVVGEAASPAVAIAAAQVALLEGEDDAARGLRLLACAEVAGDARAAEEAARLLAGEGAPLAEARSRAALLAGALDPARQAAEAARAAAPDDPAALRALALVGAAGLDGEAARLEEARLSGAADAAAELALAGEWTTLARACSALRAREEGPREERARLEAARAWGRALEWRARAGQADDAPECAAAREAALAELAPLLARVPLDELRAARRALVPDAGGLSRPALAAAELRLARCAAGLGPRPAPAREAVRIALGLGGAAAREWAEAWLGLAGDLPARALLALEDAARAGDPTRRRRRLEHAHELAPGLPPVRLARLVDELEQGADLPVRPGLWRDAAALLADAPELARGLAVLLAARTPGPDERERILGELLGDDRDTRLARAWVHLRAPGPDPQVDTREALAAARAALRHDPACAAGHLLLAEALGRVDPLPRAELLDALTCAAVAAPLAAEPHLLRLRLLSSSGEWTAADLVPLLLRGHVHRLPTVLGSDRLPRAVHLVAMARAGGKIPDLGATRDREGLLGLLGKLDPVDVGALAPFPLLVRLERTRLDDEPWEEVLSRLEALLAGLPEGPERQAATALGLSRLEGPERKALCARAARAAVRALAGLRQGGGLARAPWRWTAPGWSLGLRAEGLGAALRGALPEAPALAWTWCVELRHPAALGEVLGEALLAADLGAKGRPPLSAEDLSDPWGRSRGLVLATDSAAAQRALADWLVRQGEPLEAHLACVRAAAASLDRSPAIELRERIESLGEEHLWAGGELAEVTVAERVMAGLLEEALTRAEGDAPGTAALRGERADLHLWRAGRTDDAGRREALLRQTLDDAAAADPELTGKEGDEPRFWAHWRRVRVHGALGDREAFEKHLRRALAALPLRSEWRREAVAKDPLRPLLEPLPGYAELLEQASRAPQPR